MKPDARRPRSAHPPRPERAQLPSASHFATCPRGLEALLAEELADAGATVVRTVPAGVLFSADGEVEMRANLTSRIATRILRKVGFCRYQNEAHLYRSALDLPWPAWFDVGKTMAVRVAAQDAPLKSLNFITLKIKDAICDRFREETRARPSVNTAEPDVPVSVFLTRDTATFYLDTSGVPLFRRGFRRETAVASLKENLAAALIKLSGWVPGTPLLDPMCGAGTLLLEAADIALNRAPGRARRFAFEHFSDFDAARWQALRASAAAAERPLIELPIYGADHDPAALQLARANLAAAGLNEVVALREADVLTLDAPAPAGTLITNPPYGERLGEAAALAAWYPQLGRWLKHTLAGWQAWIIAADAQLPAHLGLKPHRRIPLYNGTLETRFFGFALVAGSMRRKPAA